jgi:acetylornithine/succinyldiaminopimelate/putrescine aminotransferase/predicted amino acid dehydrogenase
VAEQLHKTSGELYTHLMNPNFGRILESIDMLVAFEGGKGEYLFYTKHGKQVQCLDFLTNFGPDFFGINNQKLIAVAKNFFAGTNVNLCNACVPSSAAVLADKLNEMTSAAAGGGDYVVKFANSGAEGVEVAFKVVELYKYKQLDRLLEKSRSNIQRAKHAVAAGYGFSEDFLRRAVQLINEKRFAFIVEQQQLDVAACTADQILDFIYAVNEHNLLRTELATIALEKGFHGKTHGALRATYKNEYRKPYQRYLSKTLFVPPNDVQALQVAFTQQMELYYQIKFQDSQLHWQEIPWSTVSSIIVEPVMGEGGAYPLNNAFLQACRDLANQHDIALILDEIQCGLGRTGYFLSTQWSGVKGDLYILSKQLGGGIAKISATMIESKYYDKDDDILNHSSTFNEDNFSSRVALEVLNIYEADRIQERVLDTGAYLKNRLEALQQEFPQVIEKITGMGLLLAVHIADQSSSYSVFIRSLWDMESLGAIIIAHLFNVFNIRLFVTVSNEKPVIRMQPCAYIKKEQCDLVVAALRQICLILSRDNAYELMKFLTGHFTPTQPDEIKDFSHLRTVPKVDVASYIQQGGKTAFMLLHILDYTHPKKYLDHSLAQFTDAELTHLIDKFYGVSDDVYVGTRDALKIKSAVGTEVVLVPIYTLAGPTKIKDALQLAKTGTDNNQALRYLLRITETAKQEVIDLGGTALGYGGYWSIVAQYGMGYQDERIFVSAFEDEGRVKQTTGNTFTAHITALAIREAIAKVRAKGEQVTLAAIGINGNICNSAALSLLKDVERIIAVASSLPSSERAGIAICQYLLKMIVLDNEISGIAKSLLAIDSVRKKLENEAFRKSARLALEDEDQSKARELSKGLLDCLRNAADSPVILTADPKWGVQQANIIFAATNDPNVLIFKEDMPKEQDKEIYIIDTSTPHNVDKNVNELPYVHRRGGGLVTTHSGQQLIFRGTDLHEADLFACIAETLLVAVDEEAKPTVGSITVKDLENMAHAGERFGFILSENEGKTEIFTG